MSLPSGNLCFEETADTVKLKVNLKSPTSEEKDRTRFFTVSSDQSQLLTTQELNISYIVVC